MAEILNHQAANITTHLMDRISANNLMHKTAVIYETPDLSLSLTYNDLFKQVALFATTLRQKGLQKGDRIFIRLTNSPEVIIAFLGAIQVGVIPALMSTHIGNGNITEYVKETQSKILFSVLAEEPELPDSCMHYSLAHDLGTLKFGGFIGSQVAEERVISSPDEPAFITYTSGITSRSKAILHAQRFIKGIAAFDDLTKFSSDSKIAYIGDLAWSFGIYQGIFLPLYIGSTIYIYYDEKGFKPEKWWQRIVENDIDILCGTPTVFRMMALSAPVNKGALRECIAVGETISAQTCKIWNDNFNINIIQSYGQAETGIIALDYRKENNKPCKAGRMMPGVKYMVLDDEGKQVEDGVPGHLVIAKDFPSIMIKYIVPDEKNAEVIKGEWFITGDIVMQQGGLLTYLGRKESILKNKGSKISVVEIESVYRQHEHVQEVAVVESPDIELGQIFKAFIKLKQGFIASQEEAKEIQEFIFAKLSTNDVPKRIEFLDELPKTKSGKTRREALKQLEMDKFLKNHAV